MGVLAIFGHSSSEIAITGLNTGDMVMTDRVGGWVLNLIGTKVILFMGSMYSDSPRAIVVSGGT